METYSHPWRRSSVLAPDGYSQRRPGPETRSSRDGTYSLRLIPGALVSLRVTHEDYGEVVVPACQAGERVDVVLSEGASLTVHAMDGAGNSLAGVRMRVWRNRRGSAPVIDRVAETGKDGRYVFRGLTAGPSLLRLEHPDFGSPDWQHPRIPETGNVEVAVTMPTGRVIRGRVTDAVTGEPILGARVGSNWVLNRAVTSDSEGCYVFRGWTGNGDLHVIAERYGRMGKNVPPDSDTLDFELRPGDTVEGRVLGADGRPVSGALVAAVASERRGAGQEIDSRTTTTSDDGAFRLTSLRRDLEHTLVVTATGHGKFLLDFSPHPEVPGTIDLGTITLLAPRAIAGVVRRPDGTPVPGHRISIRPESAFSSGRYGTGESRRTDDLGRFRFPDLFPGAWMLELRLPAAAPLERRVVLLPDHDVSDLVLELDVGRALIVRVLDPEGEPLADARVSSGRGGWGVTTGGDGRATLTALPEGAVHVYVRLAAAQNGHHYLQETVGPFVAEGQEVAVRLSRAAEIRGRVVGPTDAEVSGLFVLGEESGGGRSGGALTDEQGRFVYLARPGTRVDLELNGSPWRGKAVGIIAPSENVVIHAEKLVTGAALTVRVLDLDGRPLVGVPVIAGSRNETTAADGRATFRGLIAERTRVAMFSIPAKGMPEDALAPPPVDVVPSGQEIELRFRRGLLTTGTVLDPTGRPLARASVRLTSASWGYSGLTGTDGRFSIATPPGETYRLVVETRRAKGTTWVGTIRDVQSGSKDLEVRLNDQ